MRLFSYVVARDFGFAPNPFYGFCTLATCKPLIRRGANPGDWIIGTGSGKENRSDRIVFAMCTLKALSFNEYWSDPRFQRKKPYMLGSKKQAFGDNIYFKDEAGVWHQENSHHSNVDGSPNEANLLHDTQTDRVLIGSDYVYWGGHGPKIPQKIRSTLCKKGPGHKSKFPEKFISEVIAWIQSLNEAGFVGPPLEWK